MTERCSVAAPCLKVTPARTLPLRVICPATRLSRENETVPRPPAHLYLACATVPVATPGKLRAACPPVWQAIGSFRRRPLSPAEPDNSPGPELASGMLAGEPDGSGGGACAGAGGSGNPVPAPGGGPGSAGGPPAACARPTSVPNAA